MEKMRTEKPKTKGGNQRLFQEREERAVRFWETACAHARKAVTASWDCGQALLELKEVSRHGEFLPALERIGIKKTTAYRLMELARAYPEISEIGKFDSVDAALRPIDEGKRKEREKKTQAFPENRTLPATAEGFEEDEPPPFVQIERVEQEEEEEEADEKPPPLHKPKESALEEAQRRAREATALCKKFCQPRIAELEKKLRANGITP